MVGSVEGNKWRECIITYTLNSYTSFTLTFSEKFECHTAVALNSIQYRTNLRTHMNHYNIH